MQGFSCGEKTWVEKRKDWDSPSFCLIVTLCLWPWGTGGRNSRSISCEDEDTTIFLESEGSCKPANVSQGNAQKTYFVDLGRGRRTGSECGGNANVSAVSFLRSRGLVNRVSGGGRRKCFPHCVCLSGKYPPDGNA